MAWVFCDREPRHPIILGDDSDADSDDSYLDRQSRRKSSITGEAKLGDPRHKMARWAKQVSAKGRLALDGNFYTYHEFMCYYGKHKGQWHWQQPTYITDYWMLTDNEMQALHNFLHSFLQLLLRKLRRVLTNDIFTAVLDHDNRYMIARFLIEDEAMANAIVSIAPVSDVASAV